MNLETLKHAKVLLIDDEESNLVLLENTLAQAGYTALRRTTDSRQAIPLFQEFQPDLLLLDLMMPPPDGFEILRQLQTLIPAGEFVPIMVLTADVGAAAKQRALTGGAKDFLTKPLDLVEVLARVRNLLETRALHRQLKNQNVVLEEKVVERTAALRASEERYRTLVETSPESVILIDSQGTILMANAAAATLHGLARTEDLVGRQLWDFFPVENREEARGQFTQHVQQAHPHPFESRLLRPDGRTVEVELTGALIRDGDGQPATMLGLARDVTEARETQRRLQRSQRLESLGTLAGGIAHDLNNALAPVLLSVELIREQHPGETEMLDLVDAGAKRAADMVRQLLTFAKGARGARVSIQPAHLLKEMQGIIQSTFSMNIQLEMRREKDLPTVQGDATQLHQVLLNLCVNARDAMPQGGRLTLEAERREVDAVYAASQPDAKPGQYVVLSVKDTGTGIPPEVLDRMFEPFFTTKGPDKGTGLGLSTVMGIVKGHGGFLQVHSEPGKGSTFAVYLPVEREGGDPAGLIKTAVEFRGQGENILLVDDEAPVREAGCAVLTKLGVKPLTASDGAEGLLLATEHRADLSAALLDLQMPHMDGLALARALRRLRPDLPIAAMSGRFEEAAQVELAELGVTVQLAKPFTEAQLAEVLQKLLAPPSPR